MKRKVRYLLIDTHCRKFFQKPLDTISRKLANHNIKPNTITVYSLIIGILSALSYIFTDYILLTLILLWLSGLLDVLDGNLARLSNKQSSFGTILDITFDRLVEAALIIGIVIKNDSLSLLAIILLISILISITIFLSVGASAKNDGYKTFRYQAGLAERTEGFIMFSLIMLFKDYQALLMIIFIIMIIITIIQRFIEAYKLLK